jgi:hypothetical protein
LPTFPVFRKGSLALLSQSRFVLEIVNQASLYACVPREISVPTELALGHLRCRVTDMPPQPNSPSGRCLETRLPSAERGCPLPSPVCALISTVESSRGREGTRPTRREDVARQSPDYPRAARRRAVEGTVSRESGFWPPVIPNLDGAHPEE